MLPDTSERVPLHTAEEVNRRIAAATESRLRWYAENPGLIPERLRALDQEWDVERTLEANAAALAFAGTVAGAALDRRWLALPALVTAFLFQHATQGWCPPLPVLRRLGFRTAREIEVERTALRILRGDFEQARSAAIGGESGADRALNVARG